MNVHLLIGTVNVWLRATWCRLRGRHVLRRMEGSVGREFYQDFGSKRGHYRIVRDDFCYACGTGVHEIRTIEPWDGGT